MYGINSPRSQISTPYTCHSWYILLTAFVNEIPVFLRAADYLTHFGMLIYSHLSEGKGSYVYDSFMDVMMGYGRTRGFSTASCEALHL